MSSPKEFLLTYVRYNLWANKALAELLKEIDQTWLDKEIASSFPSIRKTAFHIWDAEYIWLCRFKGVSLSTFPSKEFGTSVHPAEFIKCSTDFLNFIEEQGDDFFSATTTFADISGTSHCMDNVGMLMHCMNHSSFHRGQVVAMIRNAGFTGEMPRTDLIVYLRETQQR